MDLNTILLIAFAVIMLFCCGGLGRCFSRREPDDDHCEQRKEEGNARRGGCCH